MAWSDAARAAAAEMRKRKAKGQNWKTVRPLPVVGSKLTARHIQRIKHAGYVISLQPRKKIAVVNGFKRYKI